VIQIGNQVWMAENLKVTHYINGDPILNTTSDTEWEDINTGAFCCYNNSENHGSTYGYLYNWFAVSDSRGLAPQGWHVSTEDDWEELIVYLGGNDTAGGKLKEAGTSHWQSPNTGATNESGFSALHAGCRIETYGLYMYIGVGALFWIYDDNDYYYLNNTSSQVRSRYAAKNFGGSVRCVKN